MRVIRTRLAAALLAAGAAGAACAPPPAVGPAPGRVVYEPVSPALPPIPRATGPLAIEVVHPTPTTPRPNVERTFIYGSVGTGDAALAINGTPVGVAPNGAFLAFLPVPADGVWHLEAATARDRAERRVAYRTAPAPAAAPAPPAPAAVPEGAFAAPRVGTVTGGSDTLATGSDIAIGRPTPTGTFRWFLPRGARLALVERRGEQYRARLDAQTDAWIPATHVTLGEGTPPGPVALGQARLRRPAGHAELVVPARGAPFVVEVEGTTVGLTVHGARLEGAAGAAVAGTDPHVASVAARQSGADAVRYDVRLTGAPWGYVAWYESNGDLVLRLRTPPPIDPAAPLRGMRIVVDPGHPPGGATGPTGLTEAEANLAISLPLAEKLRARGAEVHLTRTAHVAVGLADRVRFAVDRDAHLLVSVHNNAFPEGVDPFRRHGTSTYYFHPFSAAFARAINREIVAETRIPDLGHIQGNLALVRPTWMPSVLTESLFMPLPEQEAALRNPGFVDRLADAHVRGIEAFLRARAGGGGAGGASTP